MRGDAAVFVLLLAGILSTVTVLILRGPLGRAFARRIEGRSSEAPELAERVADLEQRLAELEQERVRMAELEERVDFAERLLAAPGGQSGPSR